MTIFILTAYNDSTCRDLSNMCDFTTFESLNEAIDYASQCDLPYMIEEFCEEDLTDLNPSDNDCLFDDSIQYFVSADCDNWPDYFEPRDTIAEAKSIARDCINKERCSVHISKVTKKVVAER